MLRNLLNSIITGMLAVVALMLLLPVLPPNPHPEPAFLVAFCMAGTMVMLLNLVTPGGPPKCED